MTQQPPIAEGLQQVMGGISGSRASTEPASRLGPSGFDPGRIALVDIRTVLEGWSLGDKAKVAAVYRMVCQALSGIDRTQPCDNCGLAVKVHALSPSECFCSAECCEAHAERAYAIAMEARQGVETTRLHPKDDSAGPQDIAQPPSGPSHD